MTRTAPAPFFTVPDPPDRTRGRLLLITYHFPPGRAAGVLRWQKMTRHAAEHGWSTDVICCHPDSLPAIDDARLHELPPGTRAFGVSTRLPTIERLENRLWTMYKRARGSRGSSRRRGDDGPGNGPASVVARRPESLTPDEMRWQGWHRAYFARAYHAWVGHHRDAGWARDVVKMAGPLCRTTAYDAVITCGPPHMAHEAGRRIATRLACPFVMDLRDPWSLERRILEASASPLWFWLARRAERGCVARADLVVTNTDEVRNEMARRYPDHPNIITVMNGFDEFSPPGTMEPPFTVTYAGAIYLDRDPRPLFRATRVAVERLRLDPGRFRVQLIGDVQRYNGVSTETIAAQEGVREYVHLVGRQSWSALSDMLARSAILVSLYQDSRYAIPSKVFEYMQFESWILVMADAESPVARVLDGTGIDVCTPSDVNRLADLLSARYRAFEAGERPQLRERVRPFSRRAQSEKLFTALDRLVGETPRSGMQPRRSMPDGAGVVD